jgi:hypothetical protein
VRLQAGWWQKPNAGTSPVPGPAGTDVLLGASVQDRGSPASMVVSVPGAGVPWSLVTVR